MPIAAVSSTSMKPSSTLLVRISAESPSTPARNEPTSVMAPTQDSTEAFRKATANPRRLSAAAAARVRAATAAGAGRRRARSRRPRSSTTRRAGRRSPPTAPGRRSVATRSRAGAEHQGDHADAAGHHVAGPVGDGRPQQQADQGADDHRAGIDKWRSRRNPAGAPILCQRGSQRTPAARDGVTSTEG